MVDLSLLRSVRGLILLFGLLLGRERRLRQEALGSR